MRRALAVVLVMGLLAGCNAIPTQSADPEQTTAQATPVPTATVATASPTATLNPTTMQPTAVEETEAQDTEAPVPTPEIEKEYTYALALDASEWEGRRLSDVAVTDGRFTYYRRDVQYKSKKNDYRYDYYTRIMRYDKKTGKTKEIISSKGKGFIFDFYLHKNGDLYYALGENIGPDKPSCLYRYHNGKSLLLVKDVNSVSCADNDVIYYEKEVDNEDSTVGYQIVAYNILTGKRSVIEASDTYSPYAPFDKYRILYIVESGKTNIIITDTIHGINKTVQVKRGLPEIREAFVYNKILYAVTHNMDNWKSKIFRIDLGSGKVLSEINIDGNIDGSAFYHGLWCFYSSKEDKNESVINEKLNVCDLRSGKVSLLANLSIRNWNHLRWVSIEAACGYIWVYRREGGDGFYADFVKKIKIPVRWYQ